jgi:hypothetical protein
MSRRGHGSSTDQADWLKALIAAIHSLASASDLDNSDICDNLGIKKPIFMLINKI